MKASKLLLAGTALMIANAVLGADYPTKPIRLVTSAAGGGGDFVSRLIAPGLSAGLGQPVVVDNRPGVATIPTMLVVKAPADGYTLGVLGGGIIFGPLLQQAPFDTLRDLAPVTWADKSFSVLVVHPSVAASSVKDLIAFAKARPSALNFSTGGNGSTSHLGGELFKYLTRVDLVRVPYQSSSASLNAILGGEVQMGFMSASLVPGHMKSGKLKALGITSAQPSALFPGLPTIAATVPGYELIQVDTVLAPAKTPAEIINRLNREIVRTLNTPDVKQRFANDMTEVVGSRPEQLTSMLKDEIARWTKVIQFAGLKSE